MRRDSAADPLGTLAQSIARIEAESSRRTETPPPVPLQCPAIDAVLPGGGLARGAVHELMGPGHDGDQRGDGALMGFGTVALARLMQADGHARPALWCMNRRLQQVGGLLSGLVYAPGLQAMGVPVERLLLAYAGNDAETLWTMEEGLRSRAVSAVLGELCLFPPLAARRLQLAAQSHATTALVLWPGKGASTASFAETRWRLGALPSPAGSPDAGIAPHWRVRLLRARRSMAAQAWAVSWREGELTAINPDAAAVSARQEMSVRLPAGERRG